MLFLLLALTPLLLVVMIIGVWFYLLILVGAIISILGMFKSIGSREKSLNGLMIVFWIGAFIYSNLYIAKVAF